jgi:hypothetical protein
VSLAVIEIEIDIVLKPYLEKFFSLFDGLILLGFENRNGKTILRCSHAPPEVISPHTISMLGKRIDTYINNVIVGMTFMHYRLEPAEQEDHRLSHLANFL